MEVLGQQEAFNMGTYNSIQSFMSAPGNIPLVIDIDLEHAPNYYLYTNQPTGADTQLWEYVWVVEPPSGWCFIQSKWKDPDGKHMVIDIHNGSNEPRTRLDVYPKKSSSNNNQLWQPVNDISTGYVFYLSKLTAPSGDALVIDIKGKSNALNTELIVFPQKSTDYVNQIWQFL